MSRDLEQFDFFGAAKPVSTLNSRAGNAEDFQTSKPLSGPLAHRIRPLDLDKLLGQDRVLGSGKPLRHWIENDRLPSLILWGPPGCGKTTLAHIIARKTKSRFVPISAVLSGVKDIKEISASAKQYKDLQNAKTILFVDEIHRFNKSQQDALLPHVENGTVILIGATTENPSFEVNSALLSRARVIRLDRLSEDSLSEIIKNALSDSKLGFGGFFSLSNEAVNWLASISEGDARRALTALENIALAVGQTEGGNSLSLKDAQAALESALERQPMPYDRAGEEHYNIISAFIKSIRDSDANAGLYYLARMLEAGEDPKFIVRRLMIFASEDIGNADPQALLVSVAAKEAVHFIGMPEARINLAQAVCYLARAPKSNASYVGINRARAEVIKTGALPIPMHLRNAVTGIMKREGYGKGYQYPHAKTGGAPTKQDHLPEGVTTKIFYERPKSS